MSNDPQSTPLGQLAAFAREQAENLRAAHEAAEAERREREAHEAVMYAVADYAERFTVNGNPPPPLKWTGYPALGDGREPRYRIQATAYLGEGLFLAHHQPRPQDDFTRHVPFTLVAADHPDTENGLYAADIGDVTDLAEAVNHIETRRRNAAIERKRSEFQ